ADMRILLRSVGVERARSPRATAVQRRARLEALLKRAKCNVIRCSETFPDANDLLAECAHLGLEGIIAKRRDAPYRSGTRSGWIKVKTSEWRARRASGGRNSWRNRGGSSDGPGATREGIRALGLEGGLAPRRETDRQAVQPRHHQGHVRRARTCRRRC